MEARREIHAFRFCSVLLVLVMAVWLASALSGCDERITEREIPTPSPTTEAQETVVGGLENDVGHILKWG